MRESASTMCKYVLIVFHKRLFVAYDLKVLRAII